MVNDTNFCGVNTHILSSEPAAVLDVVTKPEHSQHPLVSPWSLNAHCTRGGCGRDSAVSKGERSSREKEVLKSNNPFQFLGMDFTR